MSYEFLTEYSFWLIIVIAIAVLVLGYVIFRVLRSARTAEEDSRSEIAGKETTEATASDSASVREMFLEGLALLRQQIPYRDYRYRKPWYLYLSDKDPGPTLGGAESGQESKLSWRVTDKAVLLVADRKYFQGRSPEAEAASRWKTLLKEIEAHRPLRPLDGLIVSVQASHFLHTNKEGQAELRLRADRFRSMLELLWKRLTMEKMPVYFVVAGCENVGGFKAFSQALPPGQRQQAFGWSSEFQLDTAYKPDWVEKAFTSIVEQLRFIQFGLLGSSLESKDRDQLFLFPARLERLRRPVETFLTRILDDLEPFVFRGLYFTGLGQDGVSPEDRTLFASELFSRKIFPERGMGEPIPRRFRMVNRRVRAAQCFLAFFLGLTLLSGFWTYPNLKRDRETLLKMYNQGCEGLSELKGVKCTPSGEISAAVESSQTPVEEVEDRERTLGDRMDASAQLLAEQLDTIAQVLAGQLTAPVAPRRQIDRAEGVLDCRGGLDRPMTQRSVGGETRFEYTRGLLLGMQALKTDRYGSLFVPWSWSWFSPLDERILNFMTDAFNHIILEAIENSLDAKVWRINGDFCAVVNDPTRTPFQLWRELGRYREDLREAGANLRSYDQLRTPGAGDPQTLRDVLAYVEFQGLTGLTGGFELDNRYFQKALAGAQAAHQPAKVEYMESVQLNLRAAIQRVYGKRFEENPFVVSVAVLSAVLGEAGSMEGATLDELEEIALQVQQVNRWSADPSFAWVGLPEFLPRTVYPDLLQFILDTPFLSGDSDSPTGVGQPGTRARVLRTLDSGSVEFQTLQNLLRSARSDATGLLLANQDGKWVPSEGLEEYEKWLTRMIGVLRRGAAPPETPIPPFRAGGPILWEEDELREAVGYYESYEKSAGEAPTSAMAASLPAAGQVAAHLGLLIDKADQSGIVPEIPPLEQVRNLARVSGLLGRLMDILSGLPAFEMRGSLAEVLGEQCVDALGVLHRKHLSGDGLYRAREDRLATPALRGPPVYLEAFRLSTPEDMPAYLAAQRERLSGLAKQYVAPIMSLLKKAIRGDEARLNSTVAEWENVLAELEFYEQKNPSSTLAALENFLQVEAAEIRPGACGEVTRSSFGSTRNFFRDRQRDLQQAFAERCIQRTESTYENVIAGFHGDGHRTLARFPFVSAQPGDSTRSVPWASVQPFYASAGRDLDEVLSTLETKPRQQRTAGEDDAIQFLGAARDLRNLLGESIEQEQLPALDFTVEFNVDGGGPERSAAACLPNQIIDWDLIVGNQHFQYPVFPPGEEPEGALFKGTWSYGQAVVLALRWAKDSFCRPAPQPRRAAGYAVEGETGIFEYLGPWALLRMIEAHRAARQNNSPATTLVFEVEVGSKEQLAAAGTLRRPAGEPPELRTFAYIRFTLMAAGGEDPLAMPRIPKRPPPQSLSIANQPGREERN